MTNSSDNFEVIIIGAGPAAWSAAICLVRARVKTLVIGKPEESGLVDAAEVWNYPGFVKGLPGKQLLDQMIEQGIAQGAVFEKNEVTQVQKTGSGLFLVRTADRREYMAGNLVLAHGANYIKVDLPGEDLFKGKGVHYCALCDGPLYEDKKIIVIGSGNYAAEEAIQLTAFSRDIRIVTHAPAPNFSKVYAELLAQSGIKVTSQRVDSIVGIKDTLTGIKVHPNVSRYESIGANLAFDADAVFIALGVASAGAFASQLGLEMNGNFLKADEYMRTNVPGVWTAGLARGGVNQIVKSVGDGGIAAVDIIKKIKDMPQYFDHG